MLIKPQALQQHLQKHTALLYVLVGQEVYLMEEAFTSIQKQLLQTQDYDKKSISIQAAEDWQQLAEEANSYSLFSEIVLLAVHYDKKTMDAAGKKMLMEYLQAANPRTHMIVRAPNIPAKQLSWLSNENEAVVVAFYPLTTEAMLQWIAAQLKHHGFVFSADIPNSIQHYTQGNMLACAQVIEKLSLIYSANSTITIEQVLEQLSNQCDHSLFELVDACLLGQADKAVQILRHAAATKTEATLVLWVLSQEVRLLSQLQFKLAQGGDVKNACAQLKIWPQKTSLYQLCLKRNKAAPLQQLLSFCAQLDGLIKSNHSASAWDAFESLAVSICLGKPIGATCVS